MPRVALSSAPLKKLSQSYRRSYRRESKKYSAWLVSYTFMWIIAGFFGKDTSNYRGCYAYRHACIRCHVGLLKILQVTYN